MKHQNSLIVLSIGIFIILAIVLFLIFGTGDSKTGDSKIGIVLFVIVFGTFLVGSISYIMWNEENKLKECGGDNDVFGTCGEGYTCKVSSTSTKYECITDSEDDEDMCGTYPACTEGYSCEYDLTAQEEVCVLDKEEYTCESTVDSSELGTCPPDEVCMYIREGAHKCVLENILPCGNLGRDGYCNEGASCEPDGDSHKCVAIDYECGEEDNFGYCELGSTCYPHSGTHECIPDNQLPCGFNRKFGPCGDEHAGDYCVDMGSDGAGGTLFQCQNTLPCGNMDRQGVCDGDDVCFSHDHEKDWRCVDKGVADDFDILNDLKCMDSYNDNNDTFDSEQCDVQRFCQVGQEGKNHQEKCATHCSVENKENTWQKQNWCYSYEDPANEEICNILVSPSSRDTWDHSGPEYCDVRSMCKTINADGSDNMSDARCTKYCEDNGDKTFWCPTNEDFCDNIYSSKCNQTEYCNRMGYKFGEKCVGWCQATPNRPGWCPNNDEICLYNINNIYCNAVSYCNKNDNQIEANCLGYCKSRDGKPNGCLTNTEICDRNFVTTYCDRNEYCSADDRMNTNENCLDVCLREELGDGSTVPEWCPSTLDRCRDDPSKPGCPCNIKYGNELCRKFCDDNVGERIQYCDAGVTKCGVFMEQNAINCGMSRCLNTSDSNSKCKINYFTKGQSFKIKCFQGFDGYLTIRTPTRDSKTNANGNQWLYQDGELIHFRDENGISNIFYTEMDNDHTSPTYQKYLLKSTVDYDILVSPNRITGKLETKKRPTNTLFDNYDMYDFESGGPDEIGDITQNYQSVFKIKNVFNGRYATVGNVGDNTISFEYEISYDPSDDQRYRQWFNIVIEDEVMVLPTKYILNNIMEPRMRFYLRDEATRLVLSEQQFNISGGTKPLAWMQPIGPIRSVVDGYPYVNATNCNDDKTPISSGWSVKPLPTIFRVKRPVLLEEIGNLKKFEYEIIKQVSNMSIFASSDSVKLFINDYGFFGRNHDKSLYINKFYVDSTSFFNNKFVGKLSIIQPPAGIEIVKCLKIERNSLQGDKLRLFLVDKTIMDRPGFDGPDVDDPDISDWVDLIAQKWREATFEDINDLSICTRMTGKVSNSEDPNLEKIVNFTVTSMFNSMASFIRSANVLLMGAFPYQGRALTRAYMGLAVAMSSRFKNVNPLLLYLKMYCNMTDPIAQEAMKIYSYSIITEIIKEKFANSEVVIKVLLLSMFIVNNCPNLTYELVVPVVIQKIIDYDDDITREDADAVIAEIIDAFDKILGFKEIFAGFSECAVNAEDIIDCISGFPEIPGFPRGISGELKGVSGSKRPNDVYYRHNNEDVESSSEGSNFSNDYIENVGDLINMSFGLDKAGGLGLTDDQWKMIINSR